MEVVRWKQVRRCGPPQTSQAGPLQGRSRPGHLASLEVRVCSCSSPSFPSCEVSFSHSTLSVVTACWCRGHSLLVRVPLCFTEAAFLPTQ